MGFDPQHILAAQQRLERNRKPFIKLLEGGGVPEGEEIEKLHKPTAKWLRERGIPFIHNRSDQRSTATEGAPDFTIAVGQGRTVFIEYKTKTGKLSPKQQEWHFLARRVGVEVYVFRSMEEFHNLMKELGIQ